MQWHIQTIPVFLQELTLPNANNLELWMEPDLFSTWTAQYYQRQSLNAQVALSTPISAPLSSSSRVSPPTQQTLNAQVTLTPISASIAAKYCVSPTQQSLDTQVASTPISTSIAAKYCVSPTQQSLGAQAASSTPISTLIPSKHHISVTLDNLFSNADSVD